MLTNHLANALSHILHMERLGKSSCVVRSSQFIKNVFTLFQREGYVGETTETVTARGAYLTIKLTGKVNACGVVTPRFPVTKDEILKFEKRYLPAVDFGILVVSTSKGIMTHHEAKQQGLGGKLVAYCY